MKHINNDGQKICIRKTVYALLKAMPVGTEFHGWELKDECVKVHPELKNAYIETFIRAMRHIRQDYGFNIVCINGNESLYRKDGR